MRTTIVAHLPPDNVAADEARPSEPTHAEPGGSAVETELVSLSGLSEADRAGWRELLAYHSVSAPFLDEDWVAAWVRAFRPREALVVCGWKGGRLLGPGAPQRASASRARGRTTVSHSFAYV